MSSSAAAGIAVGPTPGAAVGAEAAVAVVAAMAETARLLRPALRLLLAMRRRRQSLGATCGRTNLNYTSSSTQVHSQGL
jgi:hypothetical protein